MAMKKHLMGQ